MPATWQNLLEELAPAFRRRSRPRTTPPPSPAVTRPPCCHSSGSSLVIDGLAESR